MELLLVTILLLSIKSNVVYGSSVTEACEILPTTHQCGEQFFPVDRRNRPNRQRMEQMPSMIRRGELPW